MSFAAFAISLGVSALPTNLGLAPTSPAEAHRALAPQIALAVSSGDESHSADLELAGSLTPSIAVAARSRATRVPEDRRTFTRTTFDGSFKIMDRIVLGAGASLDPNGDRNMQYGALVKTGGLEVGIARDALPYAHGRLVFLQAFTLVGTAAEDGSGTIFTAWTHALTARVKVSVGVGFRQGATAALGFSGTL